jgi:hypothetical protein
MEQTLMIHPDRVDLQGNKFGRESSELLHDLLPTRFSLLSVMVDVTTYVVDGVVKTGEVPATHYERSI